MMKEIESIPDQALPMMNVTVHRMMAMIEHALMMSATAEMGTVMTAPVK